MLQCNRTRASLEVLPFELHYCFVHKLVLLFLQWLCNDVYAAFVFLFGLCATNFNCLNFFFCYISDNNEQSKAAFSLDHFIVNLPMSI